MTVPTMPPMPPIPTMPIAMHESEYYRFCVKEMKDSESGEDVIFSRLLNLNLKWLRTWLRKQFGVPENRHIFYVDDDGDNVPIDSECEFHEALKLAKSAFEKNSAIPLIVGTFNVSGDEQDSLINENHCLDKEQLRNVDDKPSWNKSFSPYHAFTRTTCLGPVCSSKSLLLKSEFVHDPQRHMWTVLPVQMKFDSKQCDESNETKVRRIDEQTKSKNMDIQGELNASLESHSNTLPPLWFTEYMESMKKDMVSTITNEVVKKIMKVLNKRLDSFVLSPLKELDQSENQCSSLATQHPRCSSDSIEENQKKMRSQNKKQEKSANFSERSANRPKLLSDVLIERMDQPQNVNTIKNIQMKKDVISTITNEVVKEMTELLDKIPTDPATSVSSKDPFRSQSLSSFPSSARFSRYSFGSHSNETNQNTIGPQDKDQSSDNASTMRVDESSWYSNILENSTRKLQKRLDLIKDVNCVNAEEKIKKKQHQQVVQALADDLNSDIGREEEQSVQNNTWEDLVSRKNLQTDPKLSDGRKLTRLEALMLLEKELRMNCSVTGNQMLDEGLLSRDVCNTFDNKLLEIEKDVGMLSNNKAFYKQPCDQEKREKEKEEDDDAFEIIQMPALTDELFIPFEKPVIEQQHDSSRDSPSFELVSEPPSPPCSIRLDEDHFSVNGEKLEQHSMNKTNPPNSVYVVDVHGKIFNDEHQTVNPDERVTIDLKKQPDVIYSFVMDEDILTEDEDEEARSSKLSSAEHRLYEQKSPQDNANGSYDDVRNSHASYLTVQTHCDSKTQSQCSCQSQTDSGDFTQSFHSHTTSVTDTTDMYAHSYACKYGEVMTSQGCSTKDKDVRETTTTAAAPRNNYDVHVNGGWAKEARTNEKHRYDKCPNNYSEYLCTPNNSCPCSRDNSSSDASHQSYRASRSSDRSCSNVGSKKISAGEQALLNTADSVHILPETLVSAAAQVGSFAYDTAREMFDKLRLHTKDDPLKRRGGVKRENKKPFSVGHLPF